MPQLCKPFLYMRPRTPWTSGAAPGISQRQVQGISYPRASDTAALSPCLAEAGAAMPRHGQKSSLSVQALQSRLVSTQSWMSRWSLVINSGGREILRVPMRVFSLYL